MTSPTATGINVVAELKEVVNVIPWIFVSTVESGSRDKDCSMKSGVKQKQVGMPCKAVNPNDRNAPQNLA